MTTKQSRLLGEYLKELGRIHQNPQLQNLRPQIEETYEENEDSTCEEIGKKLTEVITRSNYLQLSREATADLNIFWVKAIKELTK